MAEQCYTNVSLVRAQQKVIACPREKETQMAEPNRERAEAGRRQNTRKIMDWLSSCLRSRV